MTEQGNGNYYGVKFIPPNKKNKMTEKTYKILLLIRNIACIVLGISLYYFLKSINFIN
jgi:hypothetical protein